MGANLRGPGTGFGPRLKELREKAGLSQAQLAEKTGMNVFGVAKLEQGHREPSWATVLLITKALNVDCTAFSESGDAKSEDKSQSESSKSGAKKPAAKKGKK
jgi:transcriptional regulator with XRE-family HTH domain